MGRPTLKKHPVEQIIKRIGRTRAKKRNLQQKPNHLIKNCSVSLKRIKIDKQTFENSKIADDFSGINNLQLTKICRVNLVRLSDKKLQQLNFPAIEENYSNKQSALIERKENDMNAKYNEIHTQQQIPIRRSKRKESKQLNSLRETMGKSNQMLSFIEKSAKENLPVDPRLRSKKPETITKTNGNGKTSINNLPSKCGDNQIIRRGTRIRIPARKIFSEIFTGQLNIRSKVDNNKNDTELKNHYINCNKNGDNIGIKLQTRKKRCFGNESQNRQELSPKPKRDELTFFRGPKGKNITESIESKSRLVQTNRSKSRTKTEKAKTPENQTNKNKGKQQWPSIVEKEAKRKTKTDEKSSEIVEKTSNLVSSRFRNLIIKSNKNSKPIPVENNNKVINSQQKPISNKSSDITVFDFPSSQTDKSIKEKDNLIAELVEKGKIELVKYKKGTGRLKTKFRAKSQRTKKQKTDDLKKLNKDKNRAVEILKQNDKNITKIINENNNIVKTLTNDNIIQIESTLDENQYSTSRFSNLAQSAMKKHAKINSKIESVKQNSQTNEIFVRKTVTDKKILLAAAKNFIKKLNNISNNSQKSNKELEEMNHKTVVSPNIMNDSMPWRSNADNLPNTFYYSHNSSNLPSFSSDIPFPQSPSKRPIPRNFTNLSEISMTSNKSDIENVQPSNQKILETNPRKALTYRSPLKKINILEVINLPPLAVESLNKISTPKIKSTIIKPTTLQSNTENVTNKNDIFGFDELIDWNDGDFHVEKSTNKFEFPNKLKRKLKEVKRLSTNKIREPPKPTRLNTRNLRGLFTDSPPKEFYNIKEMLSSTMIVNNKSKLKSNINDDLGKSLEDYINVNESNSRNNISVKLFEDPLEENTFNSSSLMRTYTRTKKRKKMRHQFVTCLSSDSEESGSENEGDKKKKMKALRVKKPSDNRELEDFANSFNSMCKEVENYELVVE